MRNRVQRRSRVKETYPFTSHQSGPASVPETRRGRVRRSERRRVYAEASCSKLAETKSQSVLEEWFGEADLWAAAPAAIADAANPTPRSRAEPVANFYHHGSAE
jgi:hypothetical protein